MKILNILTRCCIPISEMEDTVLFYENLMNQKARLRFEYPEMKLRLAQVASILIIAGDEVSLAPFIHTDATYYVSNIEGYSQHLPRIGAQIIEKIQEVPTGKNMLVKHPDGQLIEYVEHWVKNEADSVLS